MAILLKLEVLKQVTRQAGDLDSLVVIINILKFILCFHFARILYLWKYNLIF